MAKIIDENPLQSIFGVSLKGMQFIDASFARESVITFGKAVPN
mgnify:CR=1 FL=1